MVQKMGSRKFPRAFKWYYEICSYWENINEPNTEKLERCQKNTIRILHCKHHPKCWVLYKERRPIDCIQPYLITNISINSHRALTLIHTRSHKLGIEVALWNQNQLHMKACKVISMQGKVSGGWVSLAFYMMYI